MEMEGEKEMTERKVSRIEKEHEGMEVRRTTWAQGDWSKVTAVGVIHFLAEDNEDEMFWVREGDWLIRDHHPKEVKPSERIEEIIGPKRNDAHDCEFYRKAIIQFLDEQWERKK